MAPDDPCASADFREYTCLLLRNLAMQRGNKGRLVAMGNKNLSSASVLCFLLCALQPPPANSLRVCAAASAALWAILFHLWKAVDTLRDDDFRACIFWKLRYEWERRFEEMASVCDFSEVLRSALRRLRG